MDVPEKPVLIFSTFNLDITTYVNGSPMNPIKIDTIQRSFATK
jgi:hypothetical protein